MGTVGLYSAKKWGQVQFPTEKPFLDRKSLTLFVKLDLTLYLFLDRKSLTLFVKLDLTRVALRSGNGELLSLKGRRYLFFYHNCVVLGIPIHPVPIRSRSAL